MMSTADEIFEAVLNAMQEAEEMGGPEGVGYINLMQRISVAALKRIDTYSQWRGLSIPHLAAIIQAEILDDVRLGTVPASVVSFSELHDYVDANCYGDVCDDSFNNMLLELCGSQDRFITFLNVVQGQVNLWIVQGNIPRVLAEEERIFDRLKAEYPHKEFTRNEHGVVFLVEEGMAIHDPTISECGRFPRLDTYGLRTADALELRTYNERRGAGKER